MPGQDITAGQAAGGRTAIPNGQETALQPTANGYLESPRHDRIPVELKIKCVELYRHTGNLYEAARLLGWNLRELRRHRQADEAFAADLLEVEREFVERAKGYMLEHMARPGNYMDRVTIARRFEPGVWGNTVDVNVKHSLERVTDLAEKARAYQARLPDGQARQPQASPELDSSVKPGPTSTP